MFEFKYNYKRQKRLYALQTVRHKYLENREK
jgi:hypothetical protein